MAAGLPGGLDDVMLHMGETRSELRLVDQGGNRLYLNTEERQAFLAAAREQDRRHPIAFPGKQPRIGASNINQPLHSEADMCLAYICLICPQPVTF